MACSRGKREKKARGKQIFSLMPLRSSPPEDLAQATEAEPW